MTDFTPAIKVYTLPPNAPHTDPLVEITSYIDYSINISRGTSQYINPPYPGQTTVTLLFDTNIIPNVQIGTWMEIHVYKASTSAYVVMHSGYVTNRSSNYRAHGLTGYILEWQFSLTTAISILQNTDWYNNTTTTTTTSVNIQNVETATGVFLWSTVNASTQWQDYGPTTWAGVDTSRISTLPNIIIGTEISSTTLTSGFRNVWDDLTTLTYGVYGYMYESPNGDINIKFPQAEAVAMTSSITLTQSMLSPDIAGGDRVDELRNTVTINEFDAIVSTYYDDNSIADYGQRSGTLDTYLNTTLDAANVANTILNGIAYPLLSTERISVNLLNPIFTNAERELLLYSPLGMLVTVEAPDPMGGTLKYLPIGCNFQISKNAFILDLQLVPYSVARNSINWNQVPYNYTWTSYGTAYPTQKWQDL